MPFLPFLWDIVDNFTFEESEQRDEDGEKGIIP